MKQLFLKILVFLITGTKGEELGYLLNNYKKYNWKMFLIDLSIGAVIATVAGLWLRSWDTPLILVFPLCGASAVISKEVIRVARKILVNKL